VGFETLETPATVLEAVRIKDRTAVVLDTSAAYAEMGGQVGDTGEILGHGGLWRVTNTRKTGDTFLHLLEDADAPEPGMEVTLTVDADRREAIQRHHTVTHLLHWALHEVVSREATQKGSSVGPEKLTFDFNSAPLTPQQALDVERLVNERIVENAPVSWTEVSYADIRDRADVMQFFGDKYGDRVRVVQIGGAPGALNGYSMELCGGTHTRATGELGLFKIVSEGAIAAGVRRIEAVSGLAAFQHVNARLGEQSGRLEELEAKLLEANKTLEKERSAGLQRQADEIAANLIGEATGEPPRILKHLGEASGDLLQKIGDALKQRQFQGVAVLTGTTDGRVNLAVGVAPALTGRFNAGKIIQAIAPVVGGKGGGRPDSARGAGRDPSKIDEALRVAAEQLG
jgi:alanyl-tRNA synthetase